MRRVIVLAQMALLVLAGCSSTPPTEPGGSAPPGKGKVHLTWLGQSMFLIRDQTRVIVTDPYGPDIGYILPQVSADIVLISHGRYKRARGMPISGDPAIIEQVGESYIGSFVVVGLPSFTDARAKRANRIYYWKMEGMSFAHMGSFGQRALSEQQEGLLRGVDVLMMPVGGRTTSDAKVAASVVKTLNPKVVIPMDYKTPAVVVDLAPVEVFSARFATVKRIGDSVELSSGELPEQTEVWIMKYKQQERS